MNFLKAKNLFFIFLFFSVSSFPASVDSGTNPGESDLSKSAQNKDSQAMPQSDNLATPVKNKKMVESSTQTVKPALIKSKRIVKNGRKFNNIAKSIMDMSSYKGSEMRLAVERMIRSHARIRSISRQSLQPAFALVDELSDDELFALGSLAVLFKPIELDREDLLEAIESIKKEQMPLTKEKMELFEKAELAIRKSHGVWDAISFMVNHAGTKLKSTFALATASLTVVVLGGVGYLLWKVNKRDDQLEQLLSAAVSSKKEIEKVIASPEKQEEFKEELKKATTKTVGDGIVLGVNEAVSALENSNVPSRTKALAESLSRAVMRGAQGSLGTPHVYQIGQIMAYSGGLNKEEHAKISLALSEGNKCQAISDYGKGKISAVEESMTAKKSFVSFAWRNPVEKQVKVQKAQNYRSKVMKLCEEYSKNNGLKADTDEMELALDVIRKYLSGGWKGRLNMELQAQASKRGLQMRHIFPTVQAIRDFEEERKFDQLKKKTLKEMDIDEITAREIVMNEEKNGRESIVSAYRKLLNEKKAPGAVKDSEANNECETGRKLGGASSGAAIGACERAREPKSEGSGSTIMSWASRACNDACELIGPKPSPDSDWDCFF